MPNSDPITGQGGQDPSLVTAGRDAARKERAVATRDSMLAQRDEEKRFGKPLVQVSINAPHKARCRGNQITIQIAEQNNGDGGPDAEILTLVYLDSATETFYQTGVYTDGSKVAL